MTETTETIVMTIKTKAPKIEKEAVVNYTVGANLAENIKLFGEDIVNLIFVEQLRVKIQAGVRKCLEGGLDPQTWTDSYKPGTRAPSITKDPKLAAREAISRMTDEERLQLIADLQAN